MPRQRSRRREKKFVPQGKAFISATFNNTLITFTDPQGNVISQSSAGSMGFSGSRKSTAFAAQRAGETAARAATEHGLKTVNVMVKGPGAGREAAIRACAAQWMSTSEKASSLVFKRLDLYFHHAVPILILRRKTLIHTMNDSRI